MTRTWTRPVAVAAAAGFATVAAVATPALSAPPNGGTRIVGATVTVDNPTLTGTDIGSLTVSLHLTDSNGIGPTTLGITESTSINCPCALVSMVDPTGIAKPVSSQTVTAKYVALQLTAGDATDGTWSGSVPLGAASAGRWALTAVGAGTLQTELQVFVGRTLYPVNGVAMGAVADITGSNWPVIHFNALPKPVAAGRSWPVSGNVYLSDTKAPLAGLTIAVSHRCSFDFGNNPRRFITTDSNGNWRASWPAPVFDVTSGCTAATVEYAVAGGAGNTREIGNAVSQASSTLPYPELSAYWVASLTARSSRVPTTLTGLLPVSSEHPGVYLQRRTSTGWAAVAHTTVDYGHRSFSFRITRAGTYRVRISRTYNVAQGYSNSVTVR